MRYMKGDEERALDAGFRRSQPARGTRYRGARQGVGRTYQLGTEGEGTDLSRKTTRGRQAMMERARRRFLPQEMTIATQRHQRRWALYKDIVMGRDISLSFWRSMNSSRRWLWRRLM